VDVAVTSLKRGRPGQATAAKGAYLLLRTIFIIVLTAVYTPGIRT
jgi:hypothetical protein